MVRVLFIDDNFLYKNVPLPVKMDRANVLSVIQIEQFTTLQDMLGSCLYEHLETAMYDQTLTADEQELMKLIKYALALHTAKALIIFTRTAAASHTNLDAQSQNQYTLDALSDSMAAKAKYVQDRIVYFVKNHTDIYDIATADGCDDDLFNDTDDGSYDGGSVYYPIGPSGGSGAAGGGGAAGGIGTIYLGGSGDC